MNAAEDETIAAQAGKAPRLAGQNRLRLIGMGFGLAFLAISAQLVALTVLPNLDEPEEARVPIEARLPRPDIVDRNGVLLASDVRVPSLFADPQKIIDVDEAVELLTANIPDLDPKQLRAKLSQKNRFAWLKREISPAERDAIFNLGIPGIGFVNETKRVYPMGRLAAHVLGYVDLDSKGIAGIEKYLDDQGALYTASIADPEAQSAYPAQISIDIRVQHVLADEIGRAITQFEALAGGAVVLDINTGEVVGLVSLPDFNPNASGKNFKSQQQNQMMSGVYELGSVIKAITFAMCFDFGTATLESRYDARFPLIIGRAAINDFRGLRRVLTVPEVFTNSSNIGTARMALEVGPQRHQEFLRKVGLFDRLLTEVPESAKPLLPPRWGKLVTATAAFGHGFAVQPLQGASVVAGLLNGGRLITPTFLKRDRATAEGLAQQVVKPKTSEIMRELFRLNVIQGTAKRADAVGYRVGGKTGTAEKVINGRYSKTNRLTSFIGAFPMEAPRYLLLVMLDDPRPSPATFGQATSGWNAVPTAGKIISRIAPLLGIEPILTEEDRKKLEKQEKQALANKTED
ncbi:MAG: penicillin-binding protein 2 [Rhizobiales bacterium]|nr:penicillin-binding protein 2 [Hyphomicrobiales bacterium]